MAHLMESVNPQAVARINGEHRPMPSVGEMVLYHPRMSEMKRGRATVPALVQLVDTDNRMLELLVIYDRDDMMSLQRIPEHVAGDRGWSRLGTDHTEAIAQLREALDLVTALLLGDFQMPEDQSAMSLIDAMDGRLGALEEAAKAAPADEAPAPRRRLRGRG